MEEGEETGEGGGRGEESGWLLAEAERGCPPLRAAREGPFGRDAFYAPTLTDTFDRDSCHF